MTIMPSFLNFMIIDMNLALCDINLCAKEKYMHTYLIFGYEINK